MSLSDFLPEFDGQIFDFNRDDFLAGLASAALHLGNPDWMVYQWGCFVLPTGSKMKLVLSLDQLITLGLQLQRLSCFENFEGLIAGFHNPSQFQDTCFEVKVANLFAQLDWVKTIRFAPEQKVRGRVKRPDFEATGIYGALYVECKRCHVFSQKTLISLNDISHRFNKVMSKCNWPNNLRLEVEMVGRLDGRINDFIHTTVQTAMVTGAATAPITAGPFRSYVVLRPDAFRLPSANWITDLMVIGNVATGLFNPEFTVLRVANYGAYERCQRSVGTRVKEALLQLREDAQCMIFIGDVPVHVGQSVWEKRLSAQIYEHIITFGIWEIEKPSPTLFYRDQDSERVSLFFR
ncbi:MAG: hypothetical protein Q8M86_08035 [Syntrophales bacterium]|nr:hypothetical protein [Syntrophales bacterium]